MKSAILQADYTFQMEELPQPEPGRGEVLVRVAYCGICGSDIHMLEAGLFPPGCVIGHEASGQIVAVGPEVKGLQKGDAVAIMPLEPCENCDSCRRGETQLCRESVARGYGLGMNPGGFSEYMLVKPSMLFRIPEGVDLKTAALTEPWAVALRGVNMAGIRIGDFALVMGAGPIGLLCISALRAVGAGMIFASEPDAYRRGLAEKAGSDMVFDSTKDYPGHEIAEKFGRMPDVVFDCAGTATSVEEAASAATAHGRIIVLGVQMGNITLFPLNWFAKELSLSFSFGYSLKEFGAAVKLLKRNAVNTDLVVSDVVPLAKVNDALQMLKSPGHSKVLVDCQ